MLYRGKGCELCNGTGYFGRTLVYEVLTVDKELTTLIDQKAEINDVINMAVKNGFKDIFEVTITKVKQGITSVEEAIRVLGNVRQSAKGRVNP